MTKNELLDATKTAGDDDDPANLRRYEEIALSLVGEGNHYLIMLVLEQAHRNGQRQTAYSLQARAAPIAENMGMLDELARDI